MKIYAMFDSNGMPLAFYNEAIHGSRKVPVYEPVEQTLEDGSIEIGQVEVGEKDNPDCLIPTDAVEITEAQWAEFLNYQGSRRWNGSDVVEYVPPAKTPDEIRAAMPALSARQLRLGLINAGYLLSEVQAAIEAMPAGQDREKALVEWEYATSFDRVHPLIAAVGASLNLTDDMIDAMWTAAAAL